MIWYVYELVNLLGTVEYVGQTIRPKIRFYDHTKREQRPDNWFGKFFGRQDISMHIIGSYATKAEALKAEYDLQIFWGLPLDGYTRTKKTQGSKNASAKLDEDQVRQIKSLLAQKISGREIARKFKIGETTIHKIKNGQAWTHVK